MVEKEVEDKTSNLGTSFKDWVQDVSLEVDKKS
jgi:hypothetical protein